MARFVRSSKYRHVFGTPFKREQSYDNIKITRHPNESNMCAVNSKFVAVVLESQGGGSFQVMPVSKVGRFDINYPKVAGHKNNVLDIAWNPFNDNVIAAADEHGEIKLWTIPDSGLTSNLETPDKVLQGHNKKVTLILWHPSASNILMSVGADPNIVIWNVETGEEVVRIDCFPDLIQSASWNYNGSKIATTCKDKNIRIIDARSGEVEQEGKGHDGNKPSRVIFCGKKDYLFSTGFSRMSDRQYALWNTGDLSKSLCRENIDTASGVLFPFWDEGSNVVYLVGKGDTQIRYFEVTDAAPYVFFLSMFQSTIPQRGCGLLPKRHNDVSKCEVMRFFKLYNNKGLVEPICFAVPRKSEMFQDDLFPPCEAGKAALTAEEWVGGANKDPWLVRFTKNGMQDMTLEESQVKGKSESKSTSSGPSNLSEYRTAYKKLLEENETLKKRIAELEGK